jgi:hypothetical protein
MLPVFLYSWTYLGLSIQRLRLPRFGEYTIDLAVDGRQEGPLPLYVRKRPSPEACPPG